MKFTKKLSIIVSVFTLFSVGICFGGSLFNSSMDSDRIVHKLPVDAVQKLMEYEAHSGDHKVAVA